MRTKSQRPRGLVGGYPRVLEGWRIPCETAILAEFSLNGLFRPCTVQPRQKASTYRLILPKGPTACGGIARGIVRGRAELMDLNVTVGCHGDIIGCDLDCGVVVPIEVIGKCGASLWTTRRLAAV